MQNVESFETVGGEYASTTSIMQRFTVFLSAILLTAAAGLAQESGGSDVIFRSDVALVRVDAQVVDSANRAITGLHVEDFVLRERGKIREIRNFATEDMPLDVLFLLDVSGSMQPHVQRMASAAREAFVALGPQDRVGIMVFDRRARVRMPFKSHRDGSGVNGLERVVHEEDFNGGTDITRSLYSAVEYVRNNARREARKAIVILTDDMTEFERDDQGVIRSLEQSDIVLSALLAPNVFDRRGGGMGGGGGYPQGGSVPNRRGGNGGWGSLGGIILGGGGMGYPRGGGGYPRGGGGGNGPVIIGNGRLKSAGTREIALDSGGDSMSVDDASALEDTLRRLRQRYALHFYLPEGVKAGEQRDLQIQLTSAALRRHPDAKVRYRGNYVAQESNNSTPSEVEGGAVEPAAPTATSTTSTSSGDKGTFSRRPRVSDPGSGANAGPMVDRDASGGWPQAGTAASSSGATPTASGTADAAQQPQQQTNKGGWPRVKP
ncbi:hypothetical protein F183_A42280 [Bryobacterales bacterium F-183]|nr:hypothetical protein F183_A42280 [Bryobacterales bacterium F-183]